MLITYIMSQSWRSLWIFFYHQDFSWFWSQYALLFVSITVLQDILGSSPMHVEVPWTTLIHHLFQQILATCRVNTAFSQPCKAIPKTLPVEEHMIIARLIRPGRTLSYAGVALSETNPVLWEDATVVCLGFLCSISTLYLFEKKVIDHWPCRKPCSDANMFATNLSQHNVFFNMFYGCFMMLQWISCLFSSDLTLTAPIRFSPFQHPAGPGGLNSLNVQRLKMFFGSLNSINGWKLNSTAGGDGDGRPLM